MRAPVAETSYPLRFVLLAFDTTPNYVDTTPFPAAATKWSYRAIYHVGDECVGIWSDTATIMVGG